MTKSKQPIERALQSQNVDLSIEDTGIAMARLNPKTHSAFDPYGGAIASKPPSRKKDLRKLGQWLEAKRKAEELKRQELALESKAKSDGLKNG